MTLVWKVFLYNEKCDCRKRGMIGLKIDPVPYAIFRMYYVCMGLFSYSEILSIG